MITEGMKYRGHTIAKVSKDQRLIAMYCPDNLGCKGRLYAINTMPARKYDNHGFPTIQIDGVGYHAFEYCREYTDLMRRFFWYTTSFMSAYREG